MNELDRYLAGIENIEHRQRMSEVFSWIKREFPQLESAIKWKQPMFMDHGTFIIAFSIAKKHMSFTPEEAVITLFSEEIIKASYEHTKMLAKIKWTDEVDYGLLGKIIAFNIKDKAECTTFFRNGHETP